jgi:hypothetical protein
MHCSSYLYSCSVIIQELRVMGLLHACSRRLGPAAGVVAQHALWHSSRSGSGQQLSFVSLLAACSMSYNSTSVVQLSSPGAHHVRRLPVHQAPPPYALRGQPCAGAFD